MKNINYICKTEINEFGKDNYNHSKIKYRDKSESNNIFINCKNNKIIDINSNKQNIKSNNIEKINFLYPIKSVPNFNSENSLSNPNFIFNKNKNIYTSNNISPKNKNLFNKIQKEIKMINLQLSSVILKNKFQLLDNIRKGNNNSYNKNINFNYNNYFSENNNNYQRNNQINNRIRKRNVVLNKNKHNDQNNYIQIKSSLKQNNNITNANSLKNIYYINNNFRINSVQHNEKNKLKTPKSGFLKIIPNNFNYNSNKIRQNNMINIPNKMKMYITTSPNYFFSKSVLNQNDNISYNISSPKSLINFAFENNINKRIIDNSDKNKIKISNTNNIRNKLPQGYFDDYLINNNINKFKKITQLRKNNTNKNNIINKNDINNKNVSKSRNEFKIENFNNFFINNAKSQKNSILQTENKIIDFSYIAGSNNKSTSLLNKNKIINNINFSFVPEKIVFDDNNNNEQNKENEENEENKNKYQPEHKDSGALIDSCNLEEKSIILENDNQEEITENSPQKKLAFEDTKLIVKYNQNDYIRNCNQVFKIKIKDEKDKNNEENNYEKILHKFISTTKLCNKLKKKNKNFKSILYKNKENNSNNISNNTNSKYNPNLALMKLNELVFDDSPIKEKNENNKELNKQKEINNKNENNNSIIQKNINFIKTLEECNKKGINYKNMTLSKREMVLLNKKKKNLCYKFKNNPQNFFTEKLTEDVIKSFQVTMDDSELLKKNKNRIINKLGRGKIKSADKDKAKLNNSFPKILN